MRKNILILLTCLGTGLGVAAQEIMVSDDVSLRNATAYEIFV